MLVLSRKQNERIRVGDSVVVTIVRVSGDKVRIGIEAPADVRVLRDELHPCGLEAELAVKAAEVRAQTERAAAAERARDAAAARLADANNAAAAASGGGRPRGGSGAAGTGTGGGHAGVAAVGIVALVVLGTIISRRLGRIVEAAFRAARS